MNRTLLAISAVTALCAAAPAAAQYLGPYESQVGADVSFDARIVALRARLDAGIRQGTITQREAWPLRRELNQLAQLEARYSYNGLTRWEREDLQRRIRALRQELRVADNGRYDRYERYGYWRDYDGGYYGQGGPLEEIVCQRRGGVGGLIDSLTGRDTCFVVGDRVTGDLYAVPYDYRTRYRDGSGVYYRSDGRTIYEIDARTNTVIGIHRMPRD